jgi:hypothetical protein
MLIQLILLQSIAHLTGDFIFQTESVSVKKETKNLKTHLFHALVIGIVSYLLSFDFGFWWASIAIAFTHLGIDLLKSHCNSSLKCKHKPSTYFFVDQFVHLFVILLVVLAYNYFLGISFYLNLPEPKTLGTILAFVFCMKPANVIIINLFSAFNIKTPSEITNSDEDGSLENAGKLIGIMERMITLVLILNAQYEAVGLVIAAKSILRFSSTAKSEYVLMGTLLSFCFAIICGVILNLT